MPAAQADPALVVRRDGAGPATSSESFRSWRREASCRAMGCEVFFPPEDEPGRERAAKAICAGCPVRLPCAVHALVNREAHGVWGGLSPADRERLSSHL
ncbi:WhiB family transcriptional regulator [Pseudonocardia sp. NPDC046786]|uniref:WhiB family transcriptional regulator n=1 Tax=Pseudonocardia sp. NPDC046786 TaxID=3155471 RepID=UPI0033BFC641